MQPHFARGFETSDQSGRGAEPMTATPWSKHFLDYASASILFAGALILPLSLATVAALINR